ncbi:hypothetical protein HKCCE3408_09650 [Rhodobacterales bacterium HKCCE3408]|nr:hypothetical protein [Rhodobacterales bacterium HKCCE3408]
MTRFALVAAAALSLAAGPVAADTALLIGNSNYDNAATVREAASVAAASRALTGVGFEVLGGRNFDTGEIRNALSELLAREEERRIVIALSGHFARSADGEVWFLGTDADTPDRGDVGGHGVPLSTIYALAAEAPGRALVLLAVEDRRLPLGRGLERGVVLGQPPQGVTAVSGSPRDITRLLWGDLMQPGTTVAEVVADNDRLTVAGFVSATVPFLDPPAETSLPDTDAAEAALWEAAEELDNEGAYRAYLSEYPFGPHAAEARARLQDFAANPVRQDEAAEAALNLSRNDRRQVQRDLTLLGHDTRGIDGIFGPGTRTAIEAWQRRVGLPVTGYLTADSRARLASAASTQRDEIAAEEARQQAERERQDRAYWAAIGQGQDEAGLRAYLDRFPQGIYADVARARLDDIEGARQSQADTAAWNAARTADTGAAYRDYLNRFPDGEYEDLALARLREIEGPVQTNPAAAQAEAALNLPPVTVRLIEQRLSQAGYNPGPVDGTLDTPAREAIAEFQADRDLPSTGYLDRPTVMQFLSDGIEVIIR